MRSRNADSLALAGCERHANELDGAAIWHDLGTARARLADRAGAFKALRNALLLDGGRAQTHLALGKPLFDTGCVDDALDCLACAVALDPSLAERSEP